MVVALQRNGPPMALVPRPCFAQPGTTSPVVSYHLLWRITMATPIRIAALALATALVACNTSVNSSLRLADGEVSEGGLSTVNGSIDVGDGCEVGGTCRTVNGSIEIGDESRVKALQTVNGSVRVGRDVTVDGDVESVNGRVLIDLGSAVSGEVTTVNGAIDLESVRLDGGIATHNGDVTLTGDTEVTGDVRIKRVRGTGSDSPLEVRIEGSAVVRGSVVVDDDSRPVVVYLDDDGAVDGEIVNAEVVRADDTDVSGAAGSGGTP